MKKRVYIAVTNDLQTDQRVHKVCQTLLNAGYEPRLIGILKSNSKPLSRPYRVERFPMIFSRSCLFYAEYNIRLFFYLLASKADIILANDTDTLLAAYCAASLRRKPIVFDAHELYTEVPELVNRKVVKKIWQSIENLILPHIKYAYTVCQPIADIYKRRNGIQMSVVRNAPFLQKPCPESKKTLSFPGKKILLYQGAINVGRGIEWVIDAMPHIPNAVFCIAGDGDILEQIRQQISDKKLEDKVVLLGRISLEELHKYTCSADLGISLLENRGLNYYYSLPNRIFDFVQAGVPVLATDFPEIRSIVEQYKIGVLTTDYSPENLASTIQSTLDYWENKADKHQIFDRAKKELCWENEEKTILNLFNKIG